MTLFVYVLLCLIWGSTWLGIKIGLADATPFYAAGFRFSLAVVILYLIAVIRKDALPASVKHFFRLGISGIFLYGFSYGLNYWALQYVGSALTSLLFASFPIFVAVLSAWFLPGEKLRLQGWLGLAVALVGMVIIFYDSLNISDNWLLGSVLIVLAAVSAAVGLIIHKRLYKGESIYVTAAVQMTIGGLPHLLVAYLVEDFAAFTFTTASVGSILYLAIFGTVVTFSGYYWLLNRMPAIAVSLIAFITPIVATFIGLAFAHESLTSANIIGSAMILGGVLAVIKR